MCVIYMYVYGMYIYIIKLCVCMCGMYIYYIYIKLCVACIYINKVWGACMHHDMNVEIKGQLGKTSSPPSTAWIPGTDPWQRAFTC